MEVLKINKFAPKREKHLIDLEKIKEKIKKIQNTDNYYISENGNVYRKYNRTKFYKIKNTINKLSGYVYCTIQVKGKHKSFRIHRLVALAFIKNKDNLPLVGYKDNNKQNNNYKNLYWTTNSDNIQKAVDDGLLINDKGEDDSQLIQIACFNKNKNFICYYGSISEAHRVLKVSKSTICRHIKHSIKGKTRCGYYFREKNEYLEKGFVL